jgi:D-sedoheptulose 7-phosphate isomerase
MVNSKFFDIDLQRVSDIASASINSSLSQLRSLSAQLTSFQEDVVKLALSIVSTSSTGNTIYIIGNGGSYCQADHLCCELSGRFETNRIGLRCHNLSSLAAFTAISNDYGFDYVYSRQLDICKDQDILIAFSTSGSSQNIINAMRTASRKGLAVFLFTGSDCPDYDFGIASTFIVPSTRTCRVQEQHMILLHLVCEIVDAILDSDTTSF